ncbi:MAG: electron transfer flavoprotein subunit alpha/FixB family protein [Gammaproteobacteria bacterium]|nr:MAG: electron transfer flavoprotein subunit alpha/FixB family protein [Gammaproteobacteria bacterium]
MSKILIIAEHDGRELNLSTAKVASCALELSAASTDIVVFGNACADVAEAAAGIEGISRVLLAERAENAAPLAAILAPQIARLADDYDYVLAPSTTFGKDVLPRAAALAGCGQISDIMAVLGARQFKRPIYAGNAIVTVEVPEGCKVFGTVRVASYKAAPGAATQAPIEAIELDVELPAHTRFIELQSGSGDRPDLQTARRVVSGGRGVGSAENFRIIFSLADKLGAAVGASRAAVDAGFVPNDMQVGQTGKIIAPELYIAFGISGAIQHLTGIKDAGTIVAVNKDPEAPIFEVADIGLVGDLFEVIPELDKALGG